MFYGLLSLLFLPAAAAFKVTAHYPHALNSIYLRGDGCSLNWDQGVKMTSTGKDTWSIDVNCAGTGAVEMKVLVDDKVWMLGANHHANANTTASTEIYPWFYTYQGSLTVIEKVYSPELNNFRDVIFYLPPSYSENTLKVHKNVLVMHDGQNLFSRATAYMGNAWMCQDTLDSTIIGGSTDEVLIVGPYNTPDRIDEYTYIYDPSEKAGGKGDLYLDWIESTLLPLTASKFRVSLQRDTLGILGSSLGGLISCYAGWTRSDVYGKVGCMSSSFWWDDNDYQKNVITASIPSSPLPTTYMDSGNTIGGEASCAEYTYQIYDYMIGVGYVENVDVFRYVDDGATHSETYWGPRFHIPMEDLYPADTV